DLARPNIALYVGGMGAVGKNFYNDLAVAYGYEKEAKLIQELYLSGKKKEAEAAVPDEFCELMSLCGPESYVRERVEAFRAAGVTMLNVIPVGPEPARLVETVKSWL
ncbi:LLM class flavin-dependent oxidoreductase, partial [Streptomyces aureus]